MIQQVLAFVRSLKPEKPSDPEEPEGAYQRAWREAAEEIEEFILDLMWEEGVDEE